MSKWKKMLDVIKSFWLFDLSMTKVKIRSFSLDFLRIYGSANKGSKSENNMKMDLMWKMEFLLEESVTTREVVRAAWLPTSAELKENSQF